MRQDDSDGPLMAWMSSLTRICSLGKAPKAPLMAGIGLAGDADQTNDSDWLADDSDRFKDDSDGIFRRP